jgi:hypothetical protein
MRCTLTSLLSCRPLPCIGKGGAKLLRRDCALPCSPARHSQQVMNRDIFLHQLACACLHMLVGVWHSSASWIHLTSTKESSVSEGAAKQDAPQPMAASTDLIPYCLWSIPAALLLGHYLSACCAITPLRAWCVIAWDSLGWVQSESVSKTIDRKLSSYGAVEQL